MNRSVHEIGSILELFDFDALGERLLNVCESVFHTVCDDSRILPEQHQVTPMTISPLPSSVANPRRTIGAKCTVAMFRIRIGVPVGELATTMFSMSARLPISPSPRINDCCSAVLHTRRRHWHCSSAGLEHAREWDVIPGELVAIHFDLIRLHLPALAVDFNDAWH